MADAVPAGLERDDTFLAHPRVPPAPLRDRHAARYLRMLADRDLALDRSAQSPSARAP
ncbi:MAG: hypothetical protein R2711_03820 [Acidimicrobiales bacterium]